MLFLFANFCVSWSTLVRHELISRLEFCLHMSSEYYSSGRAAEAETDLCKINHMPTVRIKHSLQCNKEFTTMLSSNLIFEIHLRKELFSSLWRWKKLNIREINILVESHTTCKWQSQALSCILVPKVTNNECSSFYYALLTKGSKGEARKGWRFSVIEKGAQREKKINL